MSFNDRQSIFTSTQMDYEEIVEIPDGYDKAQLKEFENGKLITGRPEMSSVSSYTFDDCGEEKTIHRFKLYLFQDNNNVYVEININLKNDGDIHRDIRKGSVLFDFITSLHEIENPGSVGNSNVIKNINLKEYREFVNRLSDMTIEVKEKTGSYTYYSFIVRDVQIK